MEDVEDDDYDQEEVFILFHLFSVFFSLQIIPIRSNFLSRTSHSQAEEEMVSCITNQPTNHHPPVCSLGLAACFSSVHRPPREAKEL